MTFWKTKNGAETAHDVIAVKFKKFEKTMLFCSRVPTYICGSSGQNSHAKKQFVYSKRLLQIQKEDMFDSAPKLFYDVKQNTRTFAAKSEYLELIRLSLKTIL